MNEVIKESREEIAEYLNRYKAEQVKSMFYLFAKLLSVNEDFRLVAINGESEALEIIEEEIGKKPICSLFDELSDEQISLLQEVMDAELHEKKVTKKKAVDLMSRAFSDDILFEGMCLSSFVDDYTFDGVMESFGCPCRYEILMQDKVYTERRKYMRMICDYTMASVNLYGVAHIKEIMTIIESYEKLNGSYEKYRRKDGSYRTSVFYSPEYYSLYTLHHMIGDDIPLVEATLSGFIVHDVFAGSTSAEIEAMGKYMKVKGIKGEMSEEDLSDFYENMEPLPYKRLHDIAIEKDKYIPKKKQFLKYADQYYIEESKAFHELEDYIRNTFKTDIRTIASEDGVREEDVVYEIVSEIQAEAYDHNIDFDDRNPTALVDFTFQMLDEEYDIRVDGIDQANEFLRYLMELANSTRLWINNGHTPNELRDMAPPYSGPTTIVPGSSNAAKLLGEVAPQIRNMGFNVDLDSNATEIPVFNYNHGMNGPVEKSVKKIYPNDPCPCGSGKKYKKCCGRNK